jgi:hypothetical protein
MQSAEDSEYFSLTDGDVLNHIQCPRAFKCVVLINGPATAEWRETVSRWLVDSGCLYMMAWGEACTLWHDSVDLANLKKFNYGDIPDDQLVMTTSHDRESLEDVFFFAKHCASHDVDLTALLILDIGTIGRKFQLKELYAKS